MDIWHHGRCWRPGGRAVPPDAWRSVIGTPDSASHREPWNTGEIVGQKVPFKLGDIWALCVRLQMGGRVREPALFDLGIDGKLGGGGIVTPIPELSTYAMLLAGLGCIVLVARRRQMQG